MKASPRRVIRAHYATLIDNRTGKQRLPDHFVFEAVPVGCAILCLIGGVEVPTDASVGLLTVAGILSAFLFGVMLQVAERAMDWSDSNPKPGPDTSRHATFLTQIAANAGYAALVSIMVATVFVVASVVNDTALAILSAIGLGLALHLLLVLLMVIRRVFAITEERLNDARTGHHSPVTLLPRQKTGSD